VTRARNFALRFGAPLAIVDKRRQKANVSEVINIIGDVKDKQAILVDDMIDTGGSLCNAAEAVIEVGGARAVYACCTHGVLSPRSAERLEKSSIEEIVLLDTIEVPEEKKIPKMTILPVSPVFAQAIQRIYSDKPVSPLFNT
jgi:ribose-phosphate pyrophosphokinase